MQLMVDLITDLQSKAEKELTTFEVAESLTNYYFAEHYSTQEDEHIVSKMAALVGQTVLEFIAKNYDQVHSPTESVFQLAVEQARTDLYPYKKQLLMAWVNGKFPAMYAKYKGTNTVFQNYLRRWSEPFKASDLKRFKQEVGL
jgi:hypothetical protein